MPIDPPLSVILAIAFVALWIPAWYLVSVYQQRRKDRADRFQQGMPTLDDIAREYRKAVHDPLEGPHAYGKAMDMAARCGYDPRDLRPMLAAREMTRIPRLPLRWRLLRWYCAKRGHRPERVKTAWNPQGVLVVQTEKSWVQEHACISCAKCGAELERVPRKEWPEYVARQKAMAGDPAFLD